MNQKTKTYKTSPDDILTEIELGLLLLLAWNSMVRW